MKLGRAPTMCRTCLISILWSGGGECRGTPGQPMKRRPRPGWRRVVAVKSGKSRSERFRTSERRRVIPLPLRRLVRRLAGLLPPPRDESLLLALRSFLGLIRGRPPVSHLLPTYDQDRVELGWVLVDAYERLGAETAGMTFRHELEAWYAYARATVADLKHWGTTVEVYENDNNRLRFRRTLDFVRPGDRIFDVGCGRGYLCGLLLRDGAVASYHAIDVVPRFVDATRDMLVANRLNDGRAELAIGDLYQLTPDRIARTGADLMICCEVLEHVADPEGALSTLADVLPQGCDLLFSVPLHGRLESVWGHVTVFDTARLQEMVRKAGLHVHHVEPVANQWTLVVASREPAVCQRVRNAPLRPPDASPVPLVDEYDFKGVDTGSITAFGLDGTRTELIEVEKGRVGCRVVAEGQLEVDRRLGGLAFPVPGLTSLKIELTIEEGDEVDQIDVVAYARDSVVGRWILNPPPPDAAGRRSSRYALRPGENSHRVRALGFEDRTAIDRIDVLAEPAEESPVTLALKAQFLP